MSFNDFFNYLGNSEGFFVFCWIVLLILSLYMLAYLWMKNAKAKNRGEVQKAQRAPEVQDATEVQIINKEATEEFSFFVVTFEIKTTKEKKKMIVREQGTDILYIGDKGMLYYEGDVFIRFEKIEK